MQASSLANANGSFLINRIGKLVATGTKQLFGSDRYQQASR
jgi:hypothetical protein